MADHDDRVRFGDRGDRHRHHRREGGGGRRRKARCWPARASPTACSPRRRTCLEHDAAKAWRRGPLQALAEVAGTGVDYAGVCVAGMVPSLTAVDGRGHPPHTGVALRRRPRGAPPRDGSRRFGRCHGGSGGGHRSRRRSGDARRRRLRALGPAGDARGAGVLAGAGRGQLRAGPGTGHRHRGGDVPREPALRRGVGREQALARLGVTESQLPTVVPMGEPAGTVAGTDAVFAGGTVDALCDQIVSGADEAGDVLVICGATLIVWAVVDGWIDVPGLWTVPHTVAGKVLVGGPEQRRRPVRGLGPGAAARRAPAPASRSPRRRRGPECLTGSPRPLAPGRPRAGAGVDPVRARGAGAVPRPVSAVRGCTGST